MNKKLLILLLAGTSCLFQTNSMQVPKKRPEDSEELAKNRKILSIELNELEQNILDSHTQEEYESALENLMKFIFKYQDYQLSSSIPSFSEVLKYAENTNPLSYKDQLREDLKSKFGEILKK